MSFRIEKECQFGRNSFDLDLCFEFDNIELFNRHSTAVRNLTKVWKTEKGPSQGGRAWSRGPESELFEILPYMQSWSTSYLDSMSLGFAKLAS